MTCHSQIWASSPFLAPVRDAYQSGLPIHWTRVNDLPDFVYFDHSIHLSKGIGCAECHGRVDRMPLMMQAQSPHMRWCLGCHRHPEKFVRPREQVYNMAWPHPGNQIELGAKLVKQYKIQQKPDCVVCHR